MVHQVESFTRLVANFEPHLMLSFIDTHSLTCMTVDETEHEQRPDIVFLHPGKERQSDHYKFSHFAGVIEVKRRSSQDPILKKSQSNGQTLVQLAKNARSLLMENMGCFVFVIGIYGKLA
jgi:predicted GNAT superfamily acetyltransferase